MLHPFGGPGPRFMALASGHFEAAPSALPDDDGDDSRGAAPAGSPDRPCAYVFGVLVITTGIGALHCLRLSTDRPTKDGPRRYRSVAVGALARFADVVEVGLTHPTAPR